MFDALPPFLIKLIISMLVFGLINGFVGSLLPFFQFNIMQLFCYSLAFGGTYIGQNQSLKFTFDLSPIAFYATFSILCSSLYGLGSFTAIAGKIGIASGIFWATGTLITMMMLVISAHNIANLPKGKGEEYADNLFAYILFTISFIQMLTFALSTVNAIIPSIQLIIPILHAATSPITTHILNYLTVISFGARIWHQYPPKEIFDKAQAMGADKFNEYAKSQLSTYGVTEPAVLESQYRRI
ncbi:MAG: hypothetical protein ACON5A_05205 [Candidatus Comchoanobacterales bacterium]